MSNLDAQEFLHWFDTRYSIELYNFAVEWVRKNGLRFEDKWKAVDAIQAAFFKERQTGPWAMKQPIRT